MKFTLDQAARTAKRLGVIFKNFTLEDLREGMNVELEHRDVTHGQALLTAKIALAHLHESPKYYRMLKDMEAKMKRRRDR